MGKYATYTCVKCQIRREAPYMEQREITKKTGNSGFSFSFNPHAKKRPTSWRVNSGRNYYRKIRQWACKDNAACNNPTYYKDLEIESEERKKRNKRAVEERRKIKIENARIEKLTRENKKLICDEIENLLKDNAYKNKIINYFNQSSKRDKFNNLYVKYNLNNNTNFDEFFNHLMENASFKSSKFNTHIIFPKAKDIHKEFFKNEDFMDRTKSIIKHLKTELNDIMQGIILHHCVVKYSKRELINIEFINLSIQTEMQQLNKIKSKKKLYKWFIPIALFLLSIYNSNPVYIYLSVISIIYSFFHKRKEYKNLKSVISSGSIDKANEIISKYDNISQKKRKEKNSTIEKVVKVDKSKLKSDLINLYNFKFLNNFCTHKLFLEVAHADGNFSKNEEDIISDIIFEDYSDVDKEVHDKFINNKRLSKDIIIKLLKKLYKEDKSALEEIVNNLFFVGEADGSLDKKEIDKIKELSLGLGLSSNSYEKILDDKLSEIEKKDNQKSIPIIDDLMADL